MKVFVTGANGFVGRVLISRLLEEGHDVVGAAGPGAAPDHRSSASYVEVDLGSPDGLDNIDLSPFNAIVHLAAASSSSDALRDPAKTWSVNVVGTVRLLQRISETLKAGAGNPLLLLISTGDVYAADSEEPQTENSPTVPRNPYVGSKLAAELAATEVAARTGLRLIIARPFPHSGAGQDARFVVPDFVGKVLEARETGLTSIEVGNMNVVRELLHVDDVVDAYVRLLEREVAEGVYNVSRGEAESLIRLLELIGVLCDHPVTPHSAERNSSATTSYLSGDSRKLQDATGWRPRASFDDVVRDVVLAQKRARGLD